MAKVKKKKLSKGKISAVVVGFVLTLTLFFVLIFIQRELLKDTEKTVIVIANKTIVAGTVITEQNVSEYLKEVEVSNTLVIPETYHEKTELIGKYVNRTIANNEIIYNGLLWSDAETLSQYENPIELSLHVGEDAAAVAGTILKGDFVNVYAELEDEDGNQFFELIAEKLLVNAVYDKNTELIAVSDKNSVALTFTFYLEQKDVSNLLDNLTEKDIFVVKVK